MAIFPSAFPTLRSAALGSNARRRSPMEVSIMSTNKLAIFSGSVMVTLGLIAVFLLPACDVNVKKEANGQDKQVDISTPVGGIHVSKQADASDVGLPIYPGAHLKQKDSDGSDKSANVNISGFGFGVKVVALDYESTDAPAKVLAFYREQLKKYGNVLECHYSGHRDVNTDFDSHDSDSKSSDLTCDDDHGANVELKVGKKDDQHIVEVETASKGSSFALVYVRTHGRNADI
jgi:hypothetical protein